MTWTFASSREAAAADRLTTPERAQTTCNTRLGYSMLDFCEVGSTLVNGEWSVRSTSPGSARRETSRNAWRQAATLTPGRSPQPQARRGYMHRRIMDNISSFQKRIFIHRR